MKKVYNISICVLSIISVVFAILDFSKGLTNIQRMVDLIIYFVFISDYLIRLYLSTNKKEFLKSNVLDLIAIIPFNSVFRIFRVLKFTKILRLTKTLKFTKLIRVFAVTSRSTNKLRKFLNTNGFKYILCLVTAAVTVSSFSMMYLEKMTFQDALWWSFVTATTVGYGDLSPKTPAGRIIASLLMLVGIGLLSSITSTITTFFLSTDTEQESDDSKIEMCLLLYNNLNDNEKESFKKMLK